MADVVLTLTIPDAKVAYAQEGFFARHKKPDDWAGTDKDWVEAVLKQHFRIEVQKGHEKLERESVIFDEGVIV